jgi:hypothetical protein
MTRGRHSTAAVAEAGAIGVEAANEELLHVSRRRRSRRRRRRRRSRAPHGSVGHDIPRCDRRSKMVLMPETTF